VGRNKKSIVLSVVAIITLLTLIVGATYAYFQANVGGSGNVDVGVETGDTDTLTFIEGEEISFNARLENFGKENGNLFGETTPKAQLIASRTLQSDTRFAEEDYNVYLIIEENDFEYTTEYGEMELRLQVLDPNGNPVTAITGLHYITTDKAGNDLAENEQGFDITTRSGSFLIAADYPITTNDILVQDWQVNVTFMNLDANQNANGGKTFKGYILMQDEGVATYEIPQVNAISQNSATYNTITTDLNVTKGTEEISKYYYGYEEVVEPTAMLGNNILRLNNEVNKENIVFEESDTSTYTFTNLKPKTTYKIYAYVKDAQGVSSNISDAQLSTEEYLLANINEISSSSTLNSITINVNATSGDGEIVKYLYSINDEEFIESDSATHTFSNLQDTSEYKIRVKVKDSNEVYSTEWFETITTETYELPNVTKVETETTYNSITLTATAEKGREEIDKYWYSIDGAEYVEGPSTYTFSTLEENTEYKIKVKVSDVNGRYSTEYGVSIKTDTYLVSTVNSVDVTTTSSTLKVKVNATKGISEIATYYYSKDGGSNWENNTSGTYTFEGLTSGATFNVVVYVEDENGRKSANYITSGTTSTIVVTPEVASSTSASGGWYSAVSISASANSTTDTPTIKYCITSSTTCEPTSSYGGVVSLGENASARRVCFQASDIEGNISEVACSNAYQVDASEPSVSTSVESSSALSNSWYSSVTIKGTGSDSYSGVTSVKYCTTTSSTCTPSTSVTGTSATASIPASTNGYRACFVAVDASGKTTSTPVCSSLYKVDTGAPSVGTPTIASSTLGTDSWYSALSIKASATDSHSGVSTVKYCISTGTADCTPSTSVTGTSATASFSTSSTSARKVCFQATDGSGRTSSTTCSETYKVDVSVPSITNLADAGDGKVSFSASDSHSGVYQYCINQNASSITSCSWKSASSGANTSASVTTSGGTYYVHLKDKAGNIKHSSSIKLEVGICTSGTNLATCIKSQYSSDGTNGIYYHNGSGTYASLEAGDNSYRYAGANPNNFVCFGSTASTCPSANLYRIIGVFGSNVKLIKYDYADKTMIGSGTYYSTLSNPNDYYKGDLTKIERHYWGNGELVYGVWSISYLRTSLNSTFLSYLGTTWSNMIASTTWYQGGMSISNSSGTNAKTAYNYELGANKRTSNFTQSCYETEESTSATTCTYPPTVTEKIGLFYISEYYYAASPTYWSYPGYDGSNGQDYSLARDYNWMHMGYTEQSISVSATAPTAILSIRPDGMSHQDGLRSWTSVRPTFNLTTTIKYSSGTGTKTNPIRITT